MPGQLKASLPAAGQPNPVVTMDLDVGHGAITTGANGIAGGAVVTGNGSAHVVLVGTAAQINLTLGTLLYKPALDYNGSDTLVATTTYGPGGPVDVDNVQITITPVADIVADSYKAAAGILEDRPTAFSMNVLANDTFANPARDITHVDGQVITPSGLEVVLSNGSGTVSLDTSGHLLFSVAHDYNGTSVFSYTVDSGGVSETANVTLDVTSVDDAPVNQAPAGAVIETGTAVVFSATAGNAIQVSDVDNATLTVTVSAANGEFFVGTYAGVTIAGNHSSSLTLSGQIDAINALLDQGLTYQPPSAYTGTSTLTVSTTDGQLTTNSLVDVQVLGALDGTAGNDVLNGGSPPEIIRGHAGNDILNGNGGNDVLDGGAGNDTMTGGLGADTFVWHLADRGTPGVPAVDTINDFAVGSAPASRDVLDLRDLLTGETHTGTSPGNLSNFLHFEDVGGGNTLLHISSTGGFFSGFSSAADDQLIALNNVPFSSLGGAVDISIITQMLANGNLKVD